MVVTYRIYANDELISPFTQDGKTYHVGAPELDLALNTINHMSFWIPSNHPQQSKLSNRTTYIQVYDDADELFRGRILEDESDFYNTGEIYVEDEKGFFRDSIVRPYGYSGTVSSFWQKLIENHNSQVDEERQFAVGVCTVEDTNDYIVRASNTAANTWSVIKDKLINMLGGFVRIRLEGKTRYADYISDYGELTGQTVAFRKNLLDILRTTVSSDIITVMIPYGAQFEQDSEGYEEEPENGEWDGNRLTIRSVNNGLDYIENEEGVAHFGQVWGTETWDDVTLPENLLKKATATLAERIYADRTITATVLDLHLVDHDIPRLKLGYRVSVFSEPHDINDTIQISHQKIRLAEPDQDEVTLGVNYKTLTGLQAEKER